MPCLYHVPTRFLYRQGMPCLYRLPTNDSELFNLPTPTNFLAQYSSKNIADHYTAAGGSMNKLIVLKINANMRNSTPRIEEDKITFF